jgi:protein-S-isoprenylcysteine O-methyltransferase Ste14
MANVRGISKADLVDFCFKLGAVTTLSYFAYDAIREWLKNPSRVTLLLIVLSACISVTVSLASRKPTIRNMSPFAVFLTLAATYYYPALVLTPGVHVIPELAGAAIQVIGIGWEIYSKLSLGRSFGMLPAHRAVMIRGAYRFVRHPIYLGYFTHYVGFLLANFGWQNFFIYTGLFVILIGRIFMEENVLKQEDQSYRLYCDRVRFRVVPLVF